MDRSTRREDFPGLRKLTLNEGLTSAKTRREKNMQQRSDSAQTFTQPKQLTLLEHRLQPNPPLTGQDDPVAHCSMYPGD